jgi:type II secretory pathway pseudopilin PulG
MGKSFWLMCRILFYILLFGFLSALAFPNDSGRRLKANMGAVSARGRDIYVAITRANTDRESLGLSPLWPKTNLASTNYPIDISGKTFKTSTAYFEAIMSQNSEETTNEALLVNGLDYSKLAGAGVPRCPHGQKLSVTNNMWLIAANLTDSDDDRIPVLITRNVDVRAIERAINYGIKTNDFKTKIPLGKGDYKTPLGNKGFVCVRKGGGTFNYQSRYATLGTLFNGQELPPRDPSKPPIVYLMP